MNLNEFLKNAPHVFISFLEEMTKSGYTLTLVGGAVRDYIHSGSAGFDWDIEVSHQHLIFDKGLWKELGRSLDKWGSVTFLPYEVIRLQTPTHQFELSPPRQEIFRAGDLKHANFDAEFDFRLSFEKAVLRRDFTINAMGIRFHHDKTLEFLDPLEGLRHLREKTLHFCGPDFAKDPVRFLRAHRFANRFKFSFSHSLKTILDEMSLEGITPAYLWKEMNKTPDPVNFISFLVQEKNKDLTLPLDQSFTAQVHEIKKILVNPRQFETWIIALEWVGLSSEGWIRYFNLGVDNSSRLVRWANSTQAFMKIMPEEFHGEFEEVIELKHFESLFDWYFNTKHLIQKYKTIPILEMIEKYVGHWIHLYQFEVIKDVRHIDPPKRAKYQVWNLCQRL
jgi:Poly A polymerase head domain